MQSSKINTKFKVRHNSLQTKQEAANGLANTQVLNQQAKERGNSYNSTLNNEQIGMKAVKHQVQGSPKFNNQMLRSKVQSAD